MFHITYVNRDGYIDTISFNSEQADEAKELIAMLEEDEALISAFYNGVEKTGNFFGIIKPWPSRQQCPVQE